MEEMNDVLWNSSTLKAVTNKFIRWLLNLEATPTGPKAVARCCTRMLKGRGGYTHHEPMLMIHVTLSAP